MRELPFKEFEFHGHTGKRRTVSFGWHYDFSGRQLTKAGERKCERVNIAAEPRSAYLLTGPARSE